MGFSSHNYTLTDHKLYSTQDGATSATQPELRRAHAAVSDLCRITSWTNIWDGTSLATPAVL